MRRSCVLLSLPMIAGIVLTLAFSQPLSAYSPPLQASETPPPVSFTLLTLNEPATGELNHAGESSTTYSFGIPAGHDILVAQEADRIVLARYCVQTTTPSGQTEDCYDESGGGGDGSISTITLIPGSAAPDVHQMVKVTLTRPTEGLVFYQLTAYPITPQNLELGQSILATPDTSSSYQLYALDTEPGQLFTVQLEDDSAEGDYLWVAAYPPMLGELVKLFEERQLFPQTLDYAFREHNTDGIMGLMLYYLGGNSFRVYVKATGSYTLSPSPLQVQTLDEHTESTVTVSYQMPVQIIRLDTTSGLTAVI